jgi:hypothetical protein
MYDFHYNFAKLMYSSNAMLMALFDGYWQFVMQNQGRGYKIVKVFKYLFGHFLINLVVIHLRTKAYKLCHRPAFTIVIEHSDSQWLFPIIEYVKISNAMLMALFDGYWQFVMQNQGRGLYQKYSFTRTWRKF